MKGEYDFKYDFKSEGFSCYFSYFYHTFSCFYRYFACIEWVYLPVCEEQYFSDQTVSIGSHNIYYLNNITMMTLSF